MVACTANCIKLLSPLTIQACFNLLRFCVFPVFPWGTLAFDCLFLFCVYASCSLLNEHRIRGYCHWYNICEVYPCFFAHNIDFHTVFSNYLLFLNSFLNVIFIWMILILFTPLVMKWKLLIIIKRINKGYGGTNCLHFIHKFSPYLHFIPFTTEVIWIATKWLKKLYKSKDIQGTKRRKELSNTQGCRNGARFNKNIFIRWDTFFFDKI